jgi:hypothetical protein
MVVISAALNLLVPRGTPSASESAENVEKVAHFPYFMAVERNRKCGVLDGLQQAEGTQLSRNDKCI